MYGPKKDPAKWLTSPCRQCGAAIECRVSRITAFCSPECRRAFGNPKPRDESKWTQTTCPTCGQAFEYLLTWPRKYCSGTCRSKATIGNIKSFAPSRFTTTCEQCGKSYETTPRVTRGRFCTRRCWGDWQAIHSVGPAHPKFGKKSGRPTRAGPAITGTCEVCGNPFPTKASHLTRRRTCSRPCDGVLKSGKMRGADNFNWRGGWDPYYGPSWRPAMRAVRARDKVCQDCGVGPEEVGRALDVHHIVRFGDFGPERHIEANALTNLIALCALCHLKREPRKGGRKAKQPA